MTGPDPTAAELIARLRRDPDDEGAYRALRAHYRARGDAASLTNLVEGWAKKASDPAAAAAAFSEAGELALRSLGDKARATGLFERARALAPASRLAFEGLAALAEAAGDARHLAELLQDRLLRLPTEARAERGRLELRLGQVWETRLGRPDEALACYARALEATPRLVPALYAARGLQLRAGNHAAAVRLLHREVEAEADPSRQRALLRELGALSGERLDDLGGAIDALERARALGPDAAVLHELATQLLTRAERDGPSAPEDRVRAAQHLVALAELLGDAQGRPYLEAALDAVPGSLEALEALEALARRRGLEDVLPARWVAFLAARPAGSGAAPRRRKLGFAYLEADQPEDARICFEALVDLEAGTGDPEVAEALAPLLRAAGRGEDATRALYVATAAASDEARVPRLRALLADHRARGDADAAAAVAVELRAFDP
ncbi:MAG: hypothetical protein AAGH15_04485, partial [Myxococcota bacterium]